MRSPLAANGLAVAVTVLLVWVAPPVGFVAAMVLLVVLPPWGRRSDRLGVCSWASWRWSSPVPAPPP
jgi:hypothetical protein